MVRRRYLLGFSIIYAFVTQGFWEAVLRERWMGSGYAALRRRPWLALELRLTPQSPGAMLIWILSAPPFPQCLTFLRSQSFLRDGSCIWNSRLKELILQPEQSYISPRGKKSCARVCLKEFFQISLLFDSLHRILFLQLLFELQQWCSGVFWPVTWWSCLPLIWWGGRRGYRWWCNVTDVNWGCQSRARRHVICSLQGQLPICSRKLLVIWLFRALVIGLSF